MPDAQGVSSFIGEFMKGYMGQVSQMEQDKVRKVSSLMDVAEQYRKLAEGATTEESYFSAQEVYRQKIEEADKLMNQKVSGIGSIMKMLGFGKKGKGGEAAMIPREWMQRPQFGDQSAIGQQEQQGPGEALPAPMQGAGVPAETPPEIPPAGEQPQPPQQLAAPAAQPGPDYSGLPWVMQNKLRIEDVRAAQKRDEDLETKRKESEIGRTASREEYAWQREQRRKEAEDLIEQYQNSPEWTSHSQDERTRIVAHIRLGIPYREPATRTSTSITRNPSGQLVRRTVDLRTNEVLNEEPYYQPANEPLIQAIIAEAAEKGISMTPDQAEAELGRRRLEGIDLTNQAKVKGLESQEELIKARRTKNEIAEKIAKGEGITMAQAISLHRSALSYGSTMARAQVDAITRSEDENHAAALEIARKFVEETGLTWDKLQSIISGKPEVDPLEEAMGYTRPDSGTSKKSTGTLLEPPK